ncbi:uncharacterized protein LOC123012499 [Tribolium madens]|uniref:uncharacterized protein LOC123012499 n=1 Tax=Tribolium madens TaxID=41895 RepID=UPI001CF72A08|nr:uncharacterized protein LOC123012499 [Tribolium madens]
MNRNAFDSIALNANKYEIDIKNYFITPPEQSSVPSDTEDSQTEEYLACKRTKFPVADAHICTWDYLTKPEVIHLLGIKSKRLRRQFIENKLHRKPKGLPRIIFRELMYSVTKFCTSSNYTVEQTGALLSQFYLTHLFFTSVLDVGPEKVYEYFKELQMCHSLPFPPHSIKLFNLEEIKNNMVHFCKLYVRNLPLVRFLCLPNFTLRVNHHLEPDIAPGKKKGKKGKKKGKGKKGKKK